MQLLCHFLCSTIQLFAAPFCSTMWLVSTSSHLMMHFSLDVSSHSIQLIMSLPLIEETCFCFLLFYDMTMQLLWCFLSFSDVTPLPLAHIHHFLLFDVTCLPLPLLQHYLLFNATHSTLLLCDVTHSTLPLIQQGKHFAATSSSMQLIFPLPLIQCDSFAASSLLTMQIFCHYLLLYNVTHLLLSLIQSTMNALSSRGLWVQIQKNDCEHLCLFGGSTSMTNFHQHKLHKRIF